MNALTARARTALRSGAGPVVALLLVAALCGSGGLCVAVLALAALGFAGYLLALWIREQRAVAARLARAPGARRPAAPLGVAW